MNRLTRRQTLGMTVVGIAGRVDASETTPLVVVLFDGTENDRYTSELISQFEAGLRGAGISSDDAVIEYHYSDSHYQLFEVPISSVIDRENVVLVAYGPMAVVMALQATDSVPTVSAYFSGVDLPALAGTAGHAGSNVIGPMLEYEGIWAERAGLLLEATGGFDSLAIVGDGRSEEDKARLARIERELGDAGFVTIVVPVAGGRDLSDAFFRVQEAGAKAALVAADTAFGSDEVKLLGHYAKEAGIAAVGPNVAYAKEGLLLGYGPNLGAVQLEAAETVAALLRGKPLSELQLVPPERLELAINITTAEKLGIELPGSLLERASSTFE